MYTYVYNCRLALSIFNYSLKDVFFNYQLKSTHLKNIYFYTGQYHNSMIDASCVLTLAQRVLISIQGQTFQIKICESGI